MIKNIFPIVLMIFLGFSQSYSQEICDNAVDDDFDGLIDLNDPDCDCDFLLPSSLIPNPSFEERTCCPQENARLDCAVGWIQASNPTTDYIHTCGNYLGNTNIPAFAPLPLADGQGAVGFRDGQAHVGPNYKEYVGACLLEPMKIGTKYRLDFYVGFRDNVYGSTDFIISLFGSTRCSDLPFGGNSNTIGCPSNTGRYQLIDENPVSGSDEWVNVAFEFVADQAYEVMILGPNCNANPKYLQDPYFYLDRLVLAETNEFGLPYEKIEGAICEDGVTLGVEFNVENTYQWYLDGIAILGETNAEIHVDNEDNVEGNYICLINTPDGCTYSQPYILRRPPYYEILNDTICEFDPYQFGQDILDSSGFYERYVTAVDGCDSIVQLFLEVIPVSYGFFEDTFCEGDSYSFHNLYTDKSGLFETIILNNAGCDSIIDVKLEEIPIGTGLVLQDRIEIELGEILNLSPLLLDPLYSNTKWTSGDNSISFSGDILENYQPLESTTIYLHAEDEYGCPVVDSTEIRVLKNNYTLYIPNIFSPNGDKLNDRFEFFVPGSIDKIQSIHIYDRWGNLAYKNEAIENTKKIISWDGSIDGQNALPGVYVYKIKATFIDGYEKVFGGDITLIR